MSKVPKYQVGQRVHCTKLSVFNDYISVKMYGVIEYIDTWSSPIHYTVKFDKPLVHRYGAWPKKIEQWNFTELHIFPIETRGKLS